MMRKQDLVERICVIVPTFNYGRFISDAIKSVLNQTFPPYEIIVVDDGSTDDTEAIVKGFGEGVRLIRQENAGVSEARNRGVRESSGDLIAFLDADDVWEPTKLEKQAARFKANPKIGLVYCGLREFFSTSGRTAEIRTAGREGQLAEGLLLWEERVMNVSGSCLMVTREAFDKIGGFDTRLRCGEDWDFCYRLALKFPIEFVPEPLVNYRIHRAGAHFNVENMELGMALFYEKAFDTSDPSVLRLQDQALGNYHRIMAGSFFHAGRYAKFASHALRSIRRRPISLYYFLSYPMRRLRHLGHSRDGAK